MAGKLAAEFHRTPCIMAISGATRLDWLNSIGYTLTFLPGMLLLLSTDASVSVCSQMSSKLRQEPFCFLAQSSREVSNTTEHLRDFHPTGPTSMLPIKL